MKIKYLIFTAFILCVCCISCKSGKYYPADNVIEQMVEKKLKDWTGAEIDFTPSRDKTESIKLVTIRNKSGDMLAIKMSESQIETLRRILQNKEEITITYDSKS